MPEFVKESHFEPSQSAVSDDPGWAEKTAPKEPPLSTTTGDGVEGEVPEPKGNGAADPAEESTDKPGASKDQTPPWVKALISKSKGEAAEARREAQLSRAELNKALEAITKLAPTQQSSAPNEPVEPQENQYDDLADYRKAMSKYAKDLAEHTSRKVLSDFQNQQQRAAIEAGQKRALEELETFLDKGRSKYEDFSDLCESDDFPCSDAMLRKAQRSEVGEDILYHLGQNPKEAKRIFRLDPVDQVSEMTRLETKIQVDLEKAKAVADKANAPVPTNAAKRPAKPITPLGSSNQASKDWEYYATKAPIEEYIKWVRDGRPQ